MSDEQIRDLSVRCAIPHFDQYFGVWAICESVFTGAVEQMRSLDLHAHIQAAKGIDYSIAESYEIVDGVAVVSISGALTKYDSSVSGGASTVRLIKAIRSAVKDTNVNAILLRIDSPGGAVAGIDDLANAVATANAKKPVTAYIEDMGASAAYWVASQASTVIASPMAQVGSIGVFMALTDSSGYAAQNGIKVHVIRTGDYKGAGTPGTEITDAQIAHFQSIVEQIGSHFNAAIQRGRGMSAEQVSAIADGRVFMADEAKALGLVDQVMRYEDAIAAISKPRKAEGDKRMSIEQDAAPQAATIGELKAACAGADSDFIVGQLEAGATVASAQSAWIAEQGKRIAKAEADLAEAKAEAERITAIGAQPLGDAGQQATHEDESDPIAEWNKQISALMSQGMTKQQAYRHLGKNNPGLRDAMDQAHNALNGRA